MQYKRKKKAGYSVLKAILSIVICNTVSLLTEETLQIVVCSTIALKSLEKTTFIEIHTIIGCLGWKGP